MARKQKKLLLSYEEWKEQNSFTLDPEEKYYLQHVEEIDVEEHLEKLHLEAYEKYVEANK